MKVTGFTIARNVLKYDYPILESIQSILPICDEFIVLVGESDDNTLEYIKSIKTNKIKIHKSVWNDTLNDGGKVLAVETNKAIKLIDQDTDWCFYIQADEVIHEKYLVPIQRAMQSNIDDIACDGLLFNYEHFFHSYNFISRSSKFYDHEIRLFKNNRGVYSYKDAQGFRMQNNKKLSVRPVDANVYHYGWARPPKKMKAKQQSIMKYFHDQEYIDKFIGEQEEFDYKKVNVFIEKFNGTHPEIMRERISKTNWEVDLRKYRKRPLFKDLLKSFLRRHLNINLNYTNYHLLD